MSVAVASLALIFLILINELLLRGHKIYYSVTKSSHEQFMIMYFDILSFAMYFSNSNIFLFEQ